MVLIVLSAAQVAAVVTTVEPRNVLPSPWPEGLQAGFAKNSIRNVGLGELFGGASGKFLAL